jgi:hypothetical protein
MKPTYLHTNAQTRQPNLVGSTVKVRSWKLAASGVRTQEYATTKNEKVAPEIIKGGNFSYYLSPKIHL